MHIKKRVKYTLFYLYNFNCIIVHYARLPVSQFYSKIFEKHNVIFELKISNINAHKGLQIKLRKWMKRDKNEFSLFLYYKNINKIFQKAL